MKYNYHTHTKRCGHASGSEEDYILRAIENGIKHMGFSDHMPMRFPDGHESEYRVPVCEGKAYCEEIKALAEKYKNQIDIKVGFEMEYYPEYFEAMLKSAVDYGAEYLLLGQHYTAPENTGVNSTTCGTDSFNELQKYSELIVSAIKSGAYTYVAHPDVFNFTGDTGLYKEQMRKICVASRVNNVPLEINFLGIRGKRNYPFDAFWEVAGEEKSPVVFGFDSHCVVDAYEIQSLYKAEKLVAEYNLNYIGVPELVMINGIK